MRLCRTLLGGNGICLPGRKPDGGFGHFSSYEHAACLSCGREYVRLVRAQIPLQRSKLRLSARKNTPTRTSGRTGRCHPEANLHGSQHAGHFIQGAAARTKGNEGRRRLEKAPSDSDILCMLHPAAVRDMNSCPARDTGSLAADRIGQGRKNIQPEAVVFRIFLDGKAAAEACVFAKAAESKGFRTA